MRRSLLLVLQLLVAGASVANVIFFRLGKMMSPRMSEIGAVIDGAIAAILLLTVAAGLACWRVAWPPGTKKLVLAAILVSTALAGFVPQIFAAHRDAVLAAERAEENRRYEETFAHELQRWATQVDVAAAAQRP